MTKNKFLIISIIFLVLQFSTIFFGIFIVPAKMGQYTGALIALLFDPITLLVSLINGFLFGYLKPSYKLFILTTITLISLVTLLIINPYRIKLNLSVDFFDFALFVRANVSLFWSASAIILINLLAKISK
ncbi:hypothetical protein MCEME33_00532 [Candidatus Pelagibacterales bacterium]